MRERERERERERNLNVWLPFIHPPLGTWPATQACALIGNQTGNPLARRPVLNPLSHTSQGKNVVITVLRIVLGYQSILNTWVS